MYYIALKMLFGDRAKYFAMIIGITFAAWMMTQQPSILVGLLSRTQSFIKDIPDPDIWVMDPGVQFVEESKPMRNVELLKVRGINGILWATPLYKSLVKAKMPDGSLATLDMTGVDNSTFIGSPYKIISQNINDFKRPDAIFVDKEAANNRLRVETGNGMSRSLAIGNTIEINDKRAIVVGFVNSTRNFVLQPQVFTTYSNALKYASQTRKTLGYILVKAKQGVDHRKLARHISEVTGLSARTSEEFKQHNLDYWMSNTGILINFGITVMLGFIVGAAIAGQTFYGFVLESLRHYAVLKAMGVTNGLIVRLVLLQAATIGFIGYGIGVGLTALFGTNLQDSVLAFKMPPILLLFAASGILVIITFSALLGIRKVTSVDPARVFRGGL